MSTDQIEEMRAFINQFAPSRERSLALTKLDECEMWLSRCERQEPVADTRNLRFAYSYTSNRK